MLRSILFKKRGKIFACIFIALIVFLWLSIYGINFAQGPNPGEIEKMKSIQIINPHPPFSLRLSLDKEGDATYTPGERIKIFFAVSQDAFVTLYSYDIEGRVKIIFPNQYSPNDFVKAGQTYSVDGLIDPNTRAGIEYVQGFATSSELLITDKEKNLISKEFMPAVSKDYKSHTNTIKAIIVTLPPNSWASSNLLSYTVRPITPPPANYGRIIITSQPQGAEVYLDNVFTGVTPLNLDRVTSGQHHVRLVIAGYQEWSNNVSFSPSRTTTVSADLISLAVYGSISIYCNQGNAKIYLDGSSQRTTSANKSVELKNVVQGQHELMITKDGFQQWVSTILVKANQTHSVSVNLVPEISYGSLAIYCNISGAKIFINGTYKVATLSSQPKILEEIKEGEYEITLVMDGYRTSIEDIWVYAGETTSLSVEMNKIEY